MKQRFIFATTVLFVLLLSSCRSSDPTSVARALVDEQVTKQSHGYLKLTNFVKHDAVLEKINGVDVYHLKYSTEVEVLKDGGYVNICELDGSNGKLTSFTIRNSPNHDDCFVFQGEKGHRYQFAETGFVMDDMGFKMTLEKHENGWVMVP